MNKKEKMNSKKREKFVRYGEGATMYHNYSAYWDHSSNYGIKNMKSSVQYIVL